MELQILCLIGVCLLLIFALITITIANATPSNGDHYYNKLEFTTPGMTETICERLASKDIPFKRKNPTTILLKNYNDAFLVDIDCKFTYNGCFLSPHKGQTSTLTIKKQLLEASKSIDSATNHFKEHPLEVKKYDEQNYFAYYKAAKQILIHTDRESEGLLINIEAILNFDIFEDTIIIKKSNDIDTIESSVAADMFEDLQEFHKKEILQIEQEKKELTELQKHDLSARHQSELVKFYGKDAVSINYPARTIRFNQVSYGFDLLTGASVRVEQVLKQGGKKSSSANIKANPIDIALGLEPSSYKIETKEKPFTFHVPRYYVDIAMKGFPINSIYLDRDEYGANELVRNINEIVLFTKEQSQSTKDDSHTSDDGCSAVDELLKLVSLKEKGYLSDEEFNAQKHKILNH